MRTRFFSILTSLLCLFALAFPVLGAQVECDGVYCFSGQDFSQDDTLAGICITALPDPSAGTVLLGKRVIRTGDILTADQLAQMSFQPLDTQTDREALVTYLPIYENRVEAAATMSIQVIGKTNQAPVAEDSAMETYKNLPNEAMLKVKDPEGETLTYSIIRQPRRGEAAIREDGSFIYTPKKNKVGVDSFTYTATDPSGNVSREATVTVTIVKPEDSTQYTDTAGESCRFAAEWMKNTGIFISESLGGNSCFRPEKEVTRGEFLTMLTGALEIQPDAESTFTGFTDEAPNWLKPYLAAAMRCGLTAGWPEGTVFNPEAPITEAEAAVMLQNALGLAPVSEDTPVSAGKESAPVWAENALTVLSSHGISFQADSNLTRGEAAEILYQVSLLAEDAPGLQAIHMAQ